MEKKSVIRDRRVQTFIEQPGYGGTLSIIIQVKLLPSAVPEQSGEDRSAKTCHPLPDPATAGRVASSCEQWAQDQVQTRLREQKLGAFRENLCKKLDLRKPMQCNALAGTLVLDVTSEQLRRLLEEPEVEAIVENKHRAPFAGQ